MHMLYKKNLEGELHPSKFLFGGLFQNLQIFYKKAMAFDFGLDIIFLETLSTPECSKLIFLSYLSHCIVQKYQV